MRILACVLMAGVLLPLPPLVGSVEGAGGERQTWRRDRWEHRERHRPFIVPRDVLIVREGYRPARRPLPPGLWKRYYRHGHLPPGWQRRVRPLPVHVERRLLLLPYGYSRGVVDGHLVVYTERGAVVDLAVLF